MDLEKRLERIANHSGYPEDLPSSVNEDAAAALCVIKHLGAENDRLKADLRSYEITFGMMHDTAAERDVLAERARQKAVEGYDEKRDDGYLHGQLGKAAACYALTGSGTAPRIAAMPPGFWPWDLEWWKPTTDRRDLVKAGALILAEIERLDRAALSKASPSEGGEA